MRLLRFSGICLLLLLEGCSRRVPVAPTETWKGPIQAPDKSYVYWTNDKGVWLFVSKTGPTKGQRELCPHGTVCNIDTVGQMFILKRSDYVTKSTDAPGH